MSLNKFNPIEIRECHDIGEFKQIREKAETHPFTMRDYSEDDKIFHMHLPIELEKGLLYTICSWNSNHIIRALTSNSFTVEECYGEEFKIGKDYMLILPCY